MRHAFVHFDLNTSDFAGVRRFYEALFDWKFVDVDMGGGAPQAQMIPPSGPGGGLQRTHSRGARSQWVPYVAVDDLRAMLARVRESGGVVVQDYVEVPGAGAQAIVQDPGGTQLGLWEMAAELLPAPVTEEVVEPEVIQDAEVVETEAGPEVIVDTPAVIEVTVAPKKQRGGRRRRAEAQVVEAEVVEPEVEATPVQESAVEEISEAPKGRTRGRKKGTAEVPVATKAEAEEPAERMAAKTRVKKAAAEEPVAEVPATKKTSKKAPGEAPAAKKTSKKAPGEAPATKKTSKKAPGEAPATKKTSKKAAAEVPAAKTTKKPGRGRR